MSSNIVPQIYPSLLSADFSNLGLEIHNVEQAGASGIHFDVMDGHFVPNLSFGAPVLKKIRSSIKTEADCHLMVQEPDHLFESFAKAGADRITIHVEACNNLLASLNKIAALGMKAGLSVKPQTPTQELVPYLDLVDLVLIMTVEPGFGGQKLIPHTLSKISSTKKLIGHRNIKIQVDGGIDNNTAKSALSEGADILVAGSYIFESKNYASAIQSLRNPL